MSKKKKIIILIIGVIALVIFFYPKNMNDHKSPVYRICRSCFGFQFEHTTSYLDENGTTRGTTTWQKCSGIPYKCKSIDERKYLE